MLLTLKQKSLIIITISIVFFIAMVFVNAFEYKKQNDENTHDPVITGKSKVCVDCHTQKGISLGAIREWKLSKHAENGITCTTCHGENEDFVHEIKGKVTASKCAACHRDQYLQYKDSKHAKAWVKMQSSPMYKAIPDEMKETMCQSCHNVGWVRTIPKEKKAEMVATEEPKKCHGIKRPEKSIFSKASAATTAKKDDKAGAAKEEASDDDFFGDEEEPVDDNFAVLDPNSKDVSVGRCDLCHTRHRFNIYEARDPQACVNCHLGHNSAMGTGGNYANSKHGIIYSIEEGDSQKAPRCLNCHPGHKNYYSLDVAKRGRVPTCSTCHMSKGHDISRGITIGGVGSGGIVEGQAKLPFKTSTISKMELEKQRISMLLLCQNCHSSQFGSRILNQADNVKRKCDKVLGEAVLIVKKLHKDGYIKAPEVGAYDEPWEFNTQSFRPDISHAELLLTELYAAYAGIWKSSYHMNDQNTQMQGWAQLNAKLSQLKAEDRHLRGKAALKKSEEVKPLIVMPTGNR